MRRCKISSGVLAVGCTDGSPNRSASDEPTTGRIDELEFNLGLDWAGWRTGERVGRGELLPLQLRNAHANSVRVKQKTKPVTRV